MSDNKQHTAPSGQPGLLALEDFGALQARYEPMPLADRARAVLKDARPALQTVEQILTDLAAHKDIAKVFDAIRANPALTGKMRASEAKNILLDASNDFIASTRHKVTAWTKTIERISQGEGISKENNKEYIPGTVSVAVALLSVNALDAYLGVIQLASAELAKMDAAHADRYQGYIVKIRRCSTLLSDYDSASALRAVIH